MVRPSNRSLINETRSLLPPCSIHGMRGTRKTSSDGLANKKTFQFSFCPTLFEGELCYQIWQDFATLAIFLSLWQFFEGFLAKLWTYFGNFLCYWATFWMLYMAKFWKNLLAIWSHWWRFKRKIIIMECPKCELNATADPLSAYWGWWMKATCWHLQDTSIRLQLKTRWEIEREGGLGIDRRPMHDKTLSILYNSDGQPFEISISPAFLRRPNDPF